MPPYHRDEPDYIVLRTQFAEEHPKVGNIDGEWLDLSKMPTFHSVVKGLFGVILEPTVQFEVSECGDVAQVWIVRDALQKPNL